MRMTPKISDKPAATRNKALALARPLSSWMRNPARVMARTASIGRTQLAHDLVWRLQFATVEIVNIHHHAAFIFYRRATDIHAHGGLVIEFAIGDGAEGRTECEPAKGFHQRCGIGAAGGTYALGQGMQGGTAHDR